MQSVAGTKSAVAPAMAARPKAARPKALAAQASIARPSFAKRVAQRGLKASRVESQRVVVVRASDDKVNALPAQCTGSPAPSRLGEKYDSNCQPIYCVTNKIAAESGHLCCRHRLLAPAPARLVAPALACRWL